MNTAVVEHSSSALAETDLVRVLGASLYPGASPDSIRMVLGYCKAAGLDPLQKPVHIVALYDSKSRQMRDVIMPGVGLYRTNAARSGAFAGMSEPEFGPDVQKTLSGVTIEFPESCRVTVKRRLPTGEIASFTAVEYWIENYAVKGGPEKSVAPNAMWQKRPRGQLAKCAQAQALRIAFPELASPMTAEEMEGKPFDPADPVGTVIEATPKELLSAGRAAADEGLETYRKWWSGITPQDRALMQQEHEALKVRAQGADATAAARKPVDAVEAHPTPPGLADGPPAEFDLDYDTGEITAAHAEEPPKKRGNKP